MKRRFSLKISTSIGVTFAFALCASCSVASAATPKSDLRPEITAEIDRILSDAFHPDAPGAAALVVHGGNVKLRKGYGLADLELGVPVDPGDVFRLCSITKQFTAVAILQLAEAGKLKLDDDITRFVPDYPTSGYTITLTHLLTHTSGIPSADEQSEWLKMWREDLTPNQIFDLTRSKPLHFTPGSDWRYSNTGYILLGKVIEKASGEAYADYIRGHILMPAGMTRSYYADDNRIIPRRARGYVRDGKGWKNAPYFSMVQTFSAGALLGTVDDLWTWEQALEAGHLLNPPDLEQASTEVRLPDGRETHYGFGWELRNIGSHATIEHGGGIPGFTAYELNIPDAGMYIALLSNTSTPSVPLATLGTRIARLALGEPANVPTVTPSSPLADYVGAYRISPDAKFVVTLKDGTLYGQLGPGSRPLRSIGPDEFIGSAEQVRLRFSRNSSHLVDKVFFRSDGPGPEQVWPRAE